MPMTWTEYPRPFGSFDEPIPLITAEPDDDTDCVVVSFNRAYLQVVIGCLTQLTQQATWDTDVQDDFLAMQERIAMLMSLFGEGAICVNCCPVFRRNPATGLPEVSYDDGLTWDYFPDGPYEGADGPPIAAPPPALAQGSDTEDICAAAWNAADVIANFYEQTAGEAAAGLYNSVLNVNKFLYQLNQSLLKIIYPDEAALAEALGFFTFDWPTYASAPTLDSAAMTALRCLLIDNATETGGIVSFDQPAVLSGIVGALGTNPGVAVALLVGYMDVAGLNAAGGVQINDHPDCSECGWTHTFTFAGGAEGWTAPAGAGWAGGHWSSGQWTTTDQSSGTSRYRDIYMERTFTSTEITSISTTFSVSYGFVASGSPTFALQSDSSNLFVSFQPTPHPASPYTWTGDDFMTQIKIALPATRRDDSGAISGSAFITKVVVKGFGTDPF